MQLFISNAFLSFKNLQFWICINLFRRPVGIFKDDQNLSLKLSKQFTLAVQKQEIFKKAKIASILQIYLKVSVFKNLLKKILKKTLENKSLLFDNLQEIIIICIPCCHIFSWKLSSGKVQNPDIALHSVHRQSSSAKQSFRVSEAMKGLIAQEHLRTNCKG